MPGRIAGACASTSLKSAQSIACCHCWLLRRASHDSDSRSRCCCCSRTRRIAAAAATAAVVMRLVRSRAEQAAPSPSNSFELGVHLAWHVPTSEPPDESLVITAHVRPTLRASSKWPNVRASASCRRFACAPRSAVLATRGEPAQSGAARNLPARLWHARARQPRQSRLPDRFRVRFLASSSRQAKRNRKLRRRPTQFSN